MAPEIRGNPGDDPRRLRLSFSLALLLHLLAFTVGNLGLAAQAEYGMAGTTGGVPGATLEAPAMEAAGVEYDDPSAAGDLPKPKPRPVDQVIPSMATGSVKSSAGGAIQIPSYFLNPPPPYPGEARKLKQEGLVVLSVDVDCRGWVASVAVKSGSGFPLLDQSAIRTVKTWRFKPARIAGVPVQTNVEIPVRFKLEVAQ